MKIKHSRLSGKKMASIVTEWIHNTPARVSARKLHLNSRTVQLWYDRIRQGIWEHREDLFFTGPVEIDETYLGNKPPGMKGTAGTGKVAVLGIFDRNTGQVQATILQGLGASGIIPEVLKHVAQGALVYTDGYGAYLHLPKLGYVHRRVFHDHAFAFGPGRNTNSIESFWAYL